MPRRLPSGAGETGEPPLGARAGLPRRTVSLWACPRRHRVQQQAQLWTLDLADRSQPGPGSKVKDVACGREEPQLLGRGHRTSEGPLSCTSHEAAPRAGEMDGAIPAGLWARTPGAGSRPPWRLLRNAALWVLGPAGSEPGWGPRTDTVPSFPRLLTPAGSEVGKPSP